MRKPDYDSGDGRVRLWLGDCLDILDGIDCDAILTDPPYGIKVCDRSDGGVGSIVSGSKFYGRETWDHESCDPMVLEWIVESGKPAIVWGGNHLPLPPSSCVLVWDKMQREFTFADAELAWTNLDCAVRIFGYSRGQLVGEGKVHPTQKPLPLMTWCLEKMRLELESVVADLYMGSATTGVACIRSGLRFVGVEREPRYFGIAVKRIERALSDEKSSLFPVSADRERQPELFEETKGGA